MVVGAVISGAFKKELLNCNECPVKKDKIKAPSKMVIFHIENFFEILDGIVI